MQPQPIPIIDFSQEIVIKTMRSGGSGGQNVNKVETAVIAQWHVDSTQYFNDHQKELIKVQLSKHINQEGWLYLRVDQHRTQLENKTKAIQKLIDKVNLALKPVKSRKPTKTPRSVLASRRENKIKQSFKKQSRRYKPDQD